MIKYDEDFIREEMRGNWIVSSKTKKVWWVMLDLIKKFDDICRRNNLRWFPIWGTLLGTVRHEGFIPWDDDVDIVMPRDDYEKLIEIAPDELEYPYFLQTTLSDEQCFYMWISLRNSETTGNRKSCLSKKQNCGIGIDIMPLDGCCDGEFMYRCSRFPVRVLSVVGNTYVNEFNNGRAASILRRFLRLFHIDYKKLYKIAEKKNKSYKWDEYNKVAFRAHADPLTKIIKRDMWDKKDFESTINMKFENITIPVPIGYDHILTQIYGDYMRIPPVEKRVEKHSVVFEPDIPYKEYTRREICNKT